MNEFKVRDFIKKVFIISVLSIIPLISFVGCGRTRHKSKMKFSDCISNLDGLVSLLGNILETIIDLILKIIDGIVDIFSILL